MERWLGIDFGLRRIGVAVGNTLTKCPQPLEVVPAHQGVPHWPTLLQFWRVWQPTGAILGWPLLLDGKIQPFALRTLAFAHQLQSKVSTPILLVDESLSSYEAELLEPKLERIDAHAAAIIVQRYLTGAKAWELDHPAIVRWMDY